MRKSTWLAPLVVALLVGGWALPIKNVDAVYEEVQERAELVLTNATIEVKQYDDFNPLGLVVSGTYDTLEYSIVDTSITGQKTITYLATKGLETIKLSKNIRVKDTIGPVIDGEDEFELRFESEFELESAFTAYDEVDGEVNVEIIGDIDRQKAGEYLVTVRAIDSSKNETTKEIKVTVLEDPEVVARNERNEKYAVLVEDAVALNNTLLANTSVSAIESMISRVNSAKNQDSDYQEKLQTLSNDLTAKLGRAEEYYAPVVTTPVSTPSTAPSQSQTTTPSTPVTTPDPQPELAPSSLGQSIANTALQFVGYPYVWGGTSPSGFDCSGLTYYAYAQHGYYIPRVAASQMVAGVGVSYPSVGDIVIYYGGGHAAIYIGNGQVVHALNPTQGILVTGLYAVGTPSAYRRILP